MTSSSHYFIAVPVPVSLKNIFAEWQRNLQEKLSYKQWPAKDDLHITLVFLGAVDNDVLTRLMKDLNQIKKNQSFALNVGELGTFGNASKPRILFADVEKTEPLASLQKQVADCTDKLGFKKEQRPYRPHITLAKKWNGPANNPAITEAKQQYKGKKVTMDVHEVVVYRIHPGQSPKYETVAAYLLGDELNGTIN